MLVGHAVVLLKYQNINMFISRDALLMPELYWELQGGGGGAQSEIIWQLSWENCAMKAVCIHVHDGQKQQ